MAFQAACFLSYRHSDSELGRYAVDDFERALTNELKLLVPFEDPIYRDERNTPGFLYQDSIAMALCRSVCMVMIYWPQYFSHEHSYCTREYRAMITLEQQRLAMLPHAERHFGLIIPVVIRGGRGDLPLELRDTRIYADLTDLSLSGRPMSRNKKFAPQVREIAQYICGRCRAFDDVAADPCSTCGDFALPKYADVKDWLDKHLKPSPWIRGGMR